MPNSQCRSGRDRGTFGIAIGRTPGLVERDLAQLDSLAVQLNGLTAQSAGPLDGAVESQNFLDGGFDQIWITDEQFPLIAIAQQREHSVADQVCGRFMAGREKQHAVGEDFLAVEAIGIVFGFQSRRKEGIASLTVARVTGWSKYSRFAPFLWYDGASLFAGAWD